MPFTQGAGCVFCQAIPGSWPLQFNPTCTQIQDVSTPKMMGRVYVFIGISGLKNMANFGYLLVKFRGCR